jgi:hypothetical protein
VPATVPPTQPTIDIGLMDLGQTKKEKRNEKYSAELQAKKKSKNAKNIVDLNFKTIVVLKRS